MDGPKERDRVAVRFDPDDRPHPERHPADHEDDAVDESEADGDADGIEVEAERRDADREDRPRADAVQEVQEHAGHRVVLGIAAGELCHECCRRRRAAVAHRHHHHRHDDRRDETACQTGE
ncbi:hypothetical protein L593_05475 [Salinarchaeum sp. Harcht-Bsk1]|nr:hypothetical protein L593_05475 [Salinarchaeum sp. Harcht-Bsk1]